MAGRSKSVGDNAVFALDNPSADVRRSQPACLPDDVTAHIGVRLNHQEYEPQCLTFEIKRVAEPLHVLRHHHCDFGSCVGIRTRLRDSYERDFYQENG